MGGGNPVPADGACVCDSFSGEYIARGEEKNPHNSFADAGENPAHLGRCDSQSAHAEQAWNLAERSWEQGAIRA